jgi:hypothetical protein
LGISDEEFRAVADLGFRILATGLLHRPLQNRSSASRRRSPHRER